MFRLFWAVGGLVPVDNEITINNVLIEIDCAVMSLKARFLPSPDYFRRPFFNLTLCGQSEPPSAFNHLLYNRTVNRLKPSASTAATSRSFDFYYFDHHLLFYCWQNAHLSVAIPLCPPPTTILLKVFNSTSFYERGHSFAVRS